VPIGRCPVLFNKLTFDKFATFRCPWDIELGSVRPPVLSEVKLDAEFFRCKDSDLDVKLTGFVFHFAFFSGRAKDAEIEGVVPAEVPDRIDVASSARKIRLDRLSESGPQYDSGLLFLNSTDLNDGRT
jgi:hypothetical protein